LEEKKKRQRKTLFNDQSINPRRYNNYKYMYVPNTGAPQYIRQMLTNIKEEIDSNTIIVGLKITPTNGQIIQTEN